jgi:hypothetical protein
MKILKTVDLHDQICNSDSDGWEPSVASGGGVVFYTANYVAGFSHDGGDHFTQVSPYGLASNFNLAFCCDQVVQYIPQIDRFAWLLQTVPDAKNENSYLLAVASPQAILDDNGALWTTYNLSSSAWFGYSNHWMDYPELAVGDNYLYLEFNIPDIGKSVIARLPLSDLANDRLQTAQHFETELFFARPVQNTGDCGYFGGTSTDSKLLVYSWTEGESDQPTSHEVDIATIPTEDTVSISPSGTDWLGAASKVRFASLYGAARSDDELWFAWNGGRRVSGQSVDTFPQPHIGIAVVNRTSFQLIEERFLWSADYAYAYPSLAANADSEVGISYAQGGGAEYVEHGVGVLTGKQELVTTTSGPTVGGGGHYVTIRRAYPNEKFFSAAGYNAPPDKTTSPPSWSNHPHYVEFGRAPCQQWIDKVAVLEVDVKHFQEALDNGEIPPPPQTPERIAQFRRQLETLKRELQSARASLSACEAENP